MDVEKLKEEQIKLSKKVSTKDSFEDFETVAGIDNAYVDKKIISAVVVCDKNLEVIDQAYSLEDIKFPYVPGFLGYREVPAMVIAYNKLNKKPDLLIVDGNGVLHPRRFGLASHLGILLDLVTIGVTKNLLLGEVKQDKVYVDNELRAICLRTKKGSKPIYVSPGNKISIKTAALICKNLIKKPHKLPEPLALAHKYANKIKKTI
jgi:deoxyribonuclease V